MKEFGRSVWNTSRDAPFGWWTSIHALRMFVGPAHIAGFIVSVIVDPIDRISHGRRATNIVQKLLERKIPRRAHGDSSTAVVLVVVGLGVVAASFYFAPAVVFATGLTMAALAVRDGAWLWGSRRITGQAPTTSFRLSCSIENGGSGADLFAADAPTDPPDARNWRAANDGQSSDCGPRNISRGHRHSAGFYNRLLRG